MIGMPYVTAGLASIMLSRPQGPYPVLLFWPDRALHSWPALLIQGSDHRSLGQNQPYIESVIENWDGPVPCLHISTTVGRRPAVHNLRLFDMSGVLVLHLK